MNIVIKDMCNQRTRDRWFVGFWLLCVGCLTLAASQCQTAPAHAMPAPGTTGGPKDGDTLTQYPLRVEDPDALTIAEMLIQTEVTAGRTLWRCDTYDWGANAVCHSWFGDGMYAENCAKDGGVLSCDWIQRYNGTSPRTIGRARYTPPSLGYGLGWVFMDFLISRRQNVTVCTVEPTGQWIVCSTSNN